MVRFSICISFIWFLFQCGAVAQEMQNQTDEKGKKTGFWVLTSEDGTFKTEEGIYENGNKDSIWKAYYPDGQLKHQITFENGIAKGKASFYFADGTLWEEGIWNEYCWIGKYNLFYPNGQTAYDWNYNSQGRREGIQKYYFENGTVKYKGEWLNGQIAGNVEVFDSTGILVQTRIYKDGVFETAKKPESILPQNQNLESDKTFSPFQGTGYHTMFKLNGEIDQKGYFKDGNLYNGEAYVYDNNDVLHQIRIFENGKLIKIKPVIQEQEP